MPRRSRYVPPRSATPVARKSSRRSSAASVGRSIAQTRCAPLRGDASTNERKRPCAISTPVLLGRASLALGGDLRARRDEPGEALGGGVHELLVANRVAEVVGERGVDVVCVHAQERHARVVE